MALAQALMRGRRPVALMVTLLLLPLIFGSPQSSLKFHLGLPRIHSGDEPHYLVTLNSLMRDGDLDLANNYAAVHRGDIQAGKEFAGQPLDHHTVWYEGAARRQWPSVFDLQTWDHDAEGHPVPRPRPGQTPPMPGQPEISTHPPGLALILAPLLLPLRGTDWVEPAAILCSTLATILALAMFRALLWRFTSRPIVVDAVTAVTFLATPVWHYGRSLFNESFLMLFAVTAYSLTLRGKSPLLAGGAVALAMLMKPTFLLLALPLLVLHVYDRNLRAAITLAIPIVLAITVTLGLNAVLLGGPLRAVQEWQPGSFIGGALGIFFSPERGLLITAPAIVVALLAWPRFLRSFPREAGILLAGAVLNFVLFASYGSWHGAACYSVRYMVPVLPLIFASLISLGDLSWWRSRNFRGVVFAICVLSIVVNGRAAIHYWKVWNTNPIYATLMSR
jgi:hypothetical protein